MSPLGSDVLIVGAGVAGLAAAEALSRAGARIRVLDRRPYLGGRAYSYTHPALGEVVDSQHVIVECCTNMVDLARRSGADEHLRWFDRIPFLEPASKHRGPRLSYLGAGSLPAPAQASWDFLSAAMLSSADKVSIARSLASFLRGFPTSDEESFSTWLARRRPSDRAVNHFWKPLVIATLNDSLENCSTRYAGKVFHELFLKSASGSRQGIPALPLSDFFSFFARLAEKQGALFHPKTSVIAIRRGADSGWETLTADNQVFAAPSLLLAVPFDQAAALLRTLPETAEQRNRILPHLDHFKWAPYTTIHLWYDRSISSLDQAAMLDGSIDWMFNKKQIRRAVDQGSSTASHYYEFSVAASFDELGQPREEVLQRTLAELPSYFPDVRGATLLKSGVLKEAKATFSVLPGMDAHRPGAGDAGGGLYLAGDWIRTGWPSTMESAARGGRLAAEAVAAACGCPQSFLTLELPPSGLMRWILPKS